jgi:2-hydroxy-6-oxonona-2,4-dienedioate hydrolase
MSESFIPWDSQALDAWAERYAQGDFVDLDGNKTHYLERGEGEPVILLHGFNLDLNSWMANLDAFASKYKVYALDLWGHGFSTRESLDYGYDLFVKQVRLFMDYLGLSSTFLVGHSMGGGTTIVFSARYPDRVRAAILLGATGYPRAIPFRASLFKLPIVSELVLGLRTNAIRRMNYRDYWIHRDELLTEEVFEKIVRFQKIKGSKKVLLSILRKDFFFKLRHEIGMLSDTEIPFLLIWGLNDHTIPPADGKKIQRVIKRSRIEILKDAGHWVNFDQAESVNQLMLDFLEDQTS